VGEGQVAAAAAQGGVGAAQAAASVGATGSAATLPAGLGWMGQASASYVGKTLIGIGMASVLAGIGLYSYVSLHKPALPRAELGPISDPIQVHRGPSDERLNLAAKAGHGLFQFDKTPPPEPETPAAEEKSQTPAAKTADKPAENPWGDILSAVQTPNGLAASNLTGLPSGSNSGSGGHSLFSALTGSGARGSLRYPAQKGHLSGKFAQGASRSVKPATAIRTRGIRANRAFAQLRFARNMSVMAARGTTSEQGMRTTAADAFEQTQTQGGTASTIDSPVAANPSMTGGEYGGGTAGLLSDPNALPAEQATPAGAVDPGQAQNYQNPMNAIKQLAKLAAMLKLISMVLIALGLCLIAIGIALMCNPYTLAAGVAILAIGIMILAMGVMMLMMAMKMAAQAKALGAALAAAQGQQYEQQDVQDCLSQATANGTDPDACNSTYNNNTVNTNTTVSQDVTAERTSTYEYQDGQPASGSGSGGGVGVGH